MTRAGSTDGAKVRDALAATKDFPGVTGNDHDQRGAQRGQAGRDPQGREREVRSLTETIKPEVGEQ